MQNILMDAINQKASYYKLLLVITSKGIKYSKSSGLF